MTKESPYRKRVCEHFLKNLTVKLGRGISKKGDNISIVKKINNIFASKNHVYKSKVLITFKDSSKEKVIVGKNNTHLITIDGELIKIIDILNIEKIN